MMPPVPSRHAAAHVGVSFALVLASFAFASDTASAFKCSDLLDEAACESVDECLDRILRSDRQGPDLCGEFCLQLDCFVTCDDPTVGLDPPTLCGGTICPSASTRDGDGCLPGVALCSAPQVGVVVGKTPFCVDPQLCPYPTVGVVPDCHTVTTCTAEGVGVVVDGNEWCVDVEPCRLPSVGLPPDCHTIALCPDGTVGIVLDEDPLCVPEPTSCPLPSVGVQPDCHSITPCPSNSIGVRIDDSATCVPTPDDQDRDGAKDADEAAAGSHPADADSRPGTDDDGDVAFDPFTGRVNSAEPARLVPHGRAACTGAYGVVSDASCGGYLAPPGGAASGALVVADAQHRVWVWDGFCEPGARGNYAPCVGARSNYAADPTRYTGRFHDDGYGWRHVATLQDRQVPAVLPCSDFEGNADGDLMPRWRFCHATVTVHPDGTYEIEEGALAHQAGDPDDTDPSRPFPPQGDITIPTELPCQEAVRDEDADGTPVVRICRATVTVHPDGAWDIVEGEESRRVGDPDDADPENPAEPLGEVAIPAVLPCAEPARDADGDGVPVLRLCQATLTVQPDGTFEFDEGDALAEPGDPDDSDPAVPCPGFVGPPGPGTFGSVCGVPVPDPRPPDADGDGVPDEHEPRLCRTENSNFNFDGTCSGEDWSPPTPEGLVADVETLLGG